jgi:hypothetical protein
MAVITASSALADTATFTFTDTNPNGDSDDNNQAKSMTFGASSSTGVLNGVTVTATAYATVSNSNTSINTTTGASELGQYGGDGLGVCSVGDSGYSSSNPTAGCNDPAHQVDNSGDYEFILFTFSTAVNLNTITLANFGTTGADQGTIDMDMSYWVNSGTPTSLTSLGAPTGNDFCGDSSEPGNQNCPAHYYDTTGGTSLTDGLTGSNVTSLLVAAYVGSTSSPADSNPDYFKVQDLNINKSGSPTPEPATFGMFGLALAGLGLIARKRKLS